MRVNARKDQQIEINGEQVDEVEEFVYLDAWTKKAERLKTYSIG